MREQADRNAGLAPGFIVSGHRGERLGIVEAIVPASTAGGAFVVLSLDSGLGNSTTLYAIPRHLIALADKERTCYLNQSGHGLKNLFGIRENDIFCRCL